MTASDDSLFDYLRLRLKAIRKKKHLTADVVASKAGLSRSTYTSIETGASRPSLDSLYRILKALKIDISSVWPGSIDFTPRGRVALSMDNLFRFREIVLLSEADSACLLLRRRTEIHVLAQFSVEERDWPVMLQLIREPADPQADWQCLWASSGKDELFLCLKQAQGPRLVHLLSEIYLPVWLAAIRFGAHELDARAVELGSLEPLSACDIP